MWVYGIGESTRADHIFTSDGQIDFGHIARNSRYIAIMHFLASLERCIASRKFAFCILQILHQFVIVIAKIIVIFDNHKNQNKNIYITKTMRNDMHFLTSPQSFALEILI